MSCPDGLAPGFGVSTPAHLAICRVKSRFGSNANGTDRLEFGTGILFFSRGGSSYVVTAAHNAWSPSLQRYCDVAQLDFGRNGAVIPITRGALNWWAPEAFMASGHADPEWDFGVFRVNLLKGVAPIALFRSQPSFLMESMICGYPNEGSCADAARPFHGSAQLTSSGAGNFGYSSLETYEGMSGAPLLGQHQSQLVSLGVHVRGLDPAEPRRAVRFLPRNVAIIGSWLGTTL